MSRLLFAAARKARICTDNHPMVPVNLMWITNAVDHEMTYRIHPDDAHRQYGPISTALREEAALCYELQPLVYDTSFGTWGIAIHDWYKFRACDDELQCSLFLLILAEALADEGL